MENKANRPRFFLKTFLIADIKFEVILRILFLKISNVDILFGKRTFMWKSYTTNKVLFTTKQVQIINLKEFVIVVLNIDNKIFVIYVTI